MFSFGHRASSFLKGISTKTTLFLPETTLLHSGTGSEIERQNTLKLLNDLKLKLQKEKKSENKKIIKNDPVSTMTLEELKVLEENLKKKGVKNWEIITDNNKKINLSIEPEKNDADINLTFSEIYTLKMAMDVLSIKEFTLIYSKEKE